MDFMSMLPMLMSMMGNNNKAGNGAQGQVGNQGPDFASMLSQMNGGQNNQMANMMKMMSMMNNGQKSPPVADQTSAHPDYSKYSNNPEYRPASSESQATPEAPFSPLGGMMTPEMMNMFSNMMNRK